MTNKNLTFSWIAFLVGLINACFVQAEPITDPKHLLSPDEAFHLTVEARPSEIITLNWQIAPGYQLYREQFRILNAKDRQPLLTYSALPKGMPRFDEVLGTYQVYEQMVVLNLTWRQSILDAGILVHYQGCADSGYCYPPLMKIIDIEKDGTYSVKDYDGTLYALEAPPNQQANTTSILELFDKSLPLTLISFLGLGILLTLTPCVLPMIPILASIIVGSKPTGLLRTLVLTTTYVLAMATTYAIAGVIAARLGYSVQAQFQSVYFIIPMVILLSVLALIQFGIIETNSM